MALLLKNFKKDHYTEFLHSISGSSCDESIDKESKLELTVFENMVTSVFLSAVATDVDSIDDEMMVGDDTVVVVVVSDGDPHITLKFPLSPS